MACLFCQIAEKKLPAEIAYEDDEIIAFSDISPKAPCHLIIIPKKHIENLNALTEADFHLAGKILHVAQQLAKKHNIHDEGYRVVTNCNDNGGQTIYHLHFHLLGGRSLTWPPG